MIAGRLTARVDHSGRTFFLLLVSSQRKKATVIAAACTQISRGCRSHEKTSDDMELVEGQLVRAADPILFAQSASVNASLCNLHSSKFIASESCEL